MSNTIFATFDDFDKAQEAVDTLVSEGYDRNQVSLVCKRELTKGRYAPTEDQLDYSATVVFDRNSEFYNPDPLENGLGQTPHPRSARGVDVDSPVNPAQDDYPRAYTRDPAAYSSAPPDAQRDYNKGLEDDNYNQSYTTEVQDDLEVDQDHDERRPATRPQGTPAPDQGGIHIHAGYNSIGALSALLKHWGLPDGDANRMERDCGNDGAVIAVGFNSAEERDKAERTMNKLGCKHIESHSAYMA